MDLGTTLRRKAGNVNKKNRGAATAIPTALVAAVVGGSNHKNHRNHKRSRIPITNPFDGGGGARVRIPMANPFESIARSRSRRRRREMVMKLVRNAGAVVTAASIAADLAAQLRETNGNHRSGNGRGED
jgi:hypothetical protein